ncbi:MAG: hypothetical protein GEV07_29130 [Streptosporangiales bacterium]|nr:hypothetical protein [Streptosporangiales bacterium]
MPTVQEAVVVPAAPAATRRRAVLAVAGWCVLVAGCFLVGHSLRARGLMPIDELPPLHARLRDEAFSWQLLPAVAGAVAAIVVLPRFASTMRWRRLLLTCWLAATAWAVLLAVSDGPFWLLEPLTHDSEYLVVAEAVGSDPIGWLRGFADDVASYPTHVAGHPPLPVLVFWLPHALGLPTLPAAAAICIGLGSSGVAAVLVTARLLLDEDRARVAAPYLVLAPSALTVATSADAMFLGVAAWGIALFALASVRHSVALGLGAGVLLGALPFLSYGLLTLGAVAVAVLLLRPSRPAVVGAVAGAALVFAAFTGAGFWWPDGALATHERWASGRGSDRPYWYVVVANFAVFALITGPAAGYALTVARGRRLWLLVGSALLALAVLDVSGVTRLEVERIWLPFVPWVLLATSEIRSAPRVWLIAQVAVAVLVQATVDLVW